jgi:hypothetical protein
MQAYYRQTSAEKGYSTPPFLWFTGEIRMLLSFFSFSFRNHIHFLAGRENGLDRGTFEKYEERR